MGHLEVQTTHIQSQRKSKTTLFSERLLKLIQNFGRKEWIAHLRACPDLTLVM